jgi:cyanophycinase
MVAGDGDGNCGSGGVQPGGRAGTGPGGPGVRPSKGTLIIVGGGSTDGTGIIEKFIQIAGGPEKKFVIVPTAGGNRDDQGNVRVYDEERSLRTWKARGLKNVVMLHTHDPKVADTDAFVKPLLDADAVWFDGGRQWNIVDSYANTRTYKAFHDVLARGGVIAGSSAGATIQATTSCAAIRRARM